MTKFKRILSPIDFSSCSNEALRFACLIAKTFGAELHMLHAVVLYHDDPHDPDKRFPDLNDIYKVLGEIAKDRMEAEVKTHQPVEVPIIKVKKRGISAAPVILEYIESKNIDLIVMGTHGRRGISHLLMGSVAEEVVKRSPIPVITVREKKNGVGKPSRILIPTDFSKYSNYAIKFALDLAQRFDATLNLLHVVEEPVPHSYYMIMNIDSVRDMYRKAVQMSKESIKQLMDDLGGDVTYCIDVVSGHPVEEIVKFTDSNKIDLIVMGSHGLGAITHFLLGSITERVLRAARCPVLTVKLPGISKSRNGTSLENIND